jgi:hypothetical protein
MQTALFAEPTAAKQAPLDALLAVGGRVIRAEVRPGVYADFVQYHETGGGWRFQIGGFKAFGNPHECNVYTLTDEGMSERAVPFDSVKSRVNIGGRWYAPKRRHH